MTTLPQAPPADAQTRRNGGPRSWLLLALKLGVTVGLLAWLFHDIDLASLYKYWRRVTPGWFALALGLQFFAYAVGVLRWWLLLRHANVRVSYLSVKPAYYLGLLFNQLLPTAVGGDAVRTYRLYRRGMGVRPLVGSAVMDRLIGTFSLVAMGAVALVLTDAFALPAHDVAAIVGLALLVVGGFLLLFSPAVHDRLQRPLARHMHIPGVQVASDIIELCHSYGRVPSLLLTAGALSVVMQGTEVGIYFVLAHDLRMHLPFTTLLAAVPVAFIAAGLPISLGGLGVREGVLVSLLVVGGADKETALALAVLFLVVVWTSVLPGLFLFLRGRH